MKLKKILAGLLSASLAFSLGTMTLAANLETPDLLQILNGLYESQEAGYALAAATADETESGSTTQYAQKMDTENTAAVMLGPAEMEESAVSVPVYVTAPAGLNGVQMTVTYGDGLTWNSENGWYDSFVYAVADVRESSEENTLSMVFANAENVEQDETGLLTILYFALDESAEARTEIALTGIMTYVTYREDDAETGTICTCIYGNSTGMSVEGCTVTVPDVEVSGIALDVSEVTLTEGKTLALTATVSPTNATDPSMTWTSSDEGVATVDETGVVTAIATGTATITATAGDCTASCEVTVESEYLLGDVNGNGEVNSTDAVLILQYVVDLITESDLNLAAADVNGNGEVNSTDAVLILQYVVGLVDANFQATT